MGAVNVNGRGGLGARGVGGIHVERFGDKRYGQSAVIPMRQACRGWGVGVRLVGRPATDANLKKNAAEKILTHFYTEVLFGGNID